MDELRWMSFASIAPVSREIKKYLDFAIPVYLYLET